MSVDSVLRTIGFLAGVYSAGLLLTVMSLASLQSAGVSPLAATHCDPRDCTAVAAHHTVTQVVTQGDPGLFSAAIYFAGKL